MSAEQDAIDEWIRDAPECLIVSMSIKDERTTTRNRASLLLETVTRRNVHITATAIFDHEQTTRNTR